MDLIEVDPVGAQTPQTPLDLLRDPPARVAELVRVVAHGPVDLRCKHHVVPAALQKRLSHNLLRLAAGVDVGGIDEVDARVERPMDDADRVVVVGVAPGAEHHRAKAQRADLHSSSSQRPKFHDRALPQMMPSITTRRHVVGRRTATLGVAYAFFVTMVGTTLPTPLYPIYEVRFGFSELIVTVVYATYAMGVLVALLLLGQSSDQVGRRPMMLVGTCVCRRELDRVSPRLGSRPLAGGPRSFRGSRRGSSPGPQRPPLSTWPPRSAPGRGTLIAAVVTIGGLGTGPLVAGLLAQFAPDALAFHMPFIWACSFQPRWHGADTGAGRGQTRRAAPRASASSASVSRARCAPVFIRAATASFAGFAVLGLFSAVRPPFLATLLQLPSPWLSGVVVCGCSPPATLGQLALELISADSSAVWMRGDGSWLRD